MCGWQEALHSQRGQTKQDNVYPPESCLWCFEAPRATIWLTVYGSPLTDTSLYTYYVHLHLRYIHVLCTRIPHALYLYICRYGLELIQVSGSIQHALSQLKSSHPQLKAVCMGTRHTDPYSSELEPFSPTDGDWPDYMRVNCILVSWQE